MYNMRTSPSYPLQDVTMAPAKSKVTTYGKSTKVGLNTPQKGKVTPRKAPKESPRKAVRVEDSDDEFLEAEEQILRQFDLNYRFGPCAGITRLERQVYLGRVRGSADRSWCTPKTCRWERAEQLGLAPPKAVRELILAGGEGANQNIWHGRLGMM